MFQHILPETKTWVLHISVMHDKFEGKQACFSCPTQVRKIEFMSHGQIQS